jgi:hypothetical protein
MMGVEIIKVSYKDTRKIGLNQKHASYILRLDTQATMMVLVSQEGHTRFVLVHITRLTRPSRYHVVPQYFNHRHSLKETQKEHN